MAIDSIRPGGLTALAVFNFVFGCLDSLGLLPYVIGLGVVAGGNRPAGPNNPGFTSLAVIVSLGAVGILLLFISGIGYLMQKKFIGRVLGSAYAVVALTNSIVTVVFVSKDLSMFNIVGFIYPVVTIVLINTTFREDFVN